MKSTLKRAVVTLAVIGLLVVVPSMCGTWTQLSKQGRRVWHDVGVGMGLIEEPQPVSVSVIIKPDGSCTTNGKEWDPPVAVKTQVYDTVQVVGGTLGVYNQDEYPILISAPTKEWALAAGLVTLRIRDITTEGWVGADPQPDPPEGTELVFAVQAVAGEAFAGAVETHEFVYMADALTWEVVRDFSVRTGAQRLTRTESTITGPGREQGPVYSREVAETDAWEGLPPPYSWAVTFGELTLSGEQQWDAGLEEWLPVVGPINTVGVALQQHKGVTGVTYADVVLTWCDVPVSFDGRAYTSTPLRFTGEGNKITVDLVDAFAGNAQHSVAIWRPYLPDFSEFAVVDRIGTLIDTLRIEGGFKVDKRYAWTLPYGDPGTTIYPTVAEIRAIGQYSTPPAVTGMSYTDTDYEHQLWTPPLSFAINAASARAHKLI